jgi:hypothetical protein
MKRFIPVRAQFVKSLSYLGVLPMAASRIRNLPLRLVSSTPCQTVSKQRHPWQRRLDLQRGGQSQSGIANTVIGTGWTKPGKLYWQPNRHSSANKRPKKPRIKNVNGSFSERWKCWPMISQGRGELQISWNVTLSRPVRYSIPPFLPLFIYLKIQRCLHFHVRLAKNHLQPRPELVGKLGIRMLGVDPNLLPIRSKCIKIHHQSNHLGPLTSPRPTAPQFPPAAHRLTVIQVPTLLT